MSVANARNEAKVGLRVERFVKILRHLLATSGGA